MVFAASLFLFCFSFCVFLRVSEETFCLLSSTPVLKPCDTGENDLKRLLVGIRWWW